MEKLAYCLIQTKNPLSGEWLVILCLCKLCKEWLFIKASLAHLQLSWSDGKVSGWNSRIISCSLCNPQIDSMWKSKNNKKNKRGLFFFYTWLHRITVPSSNFWAHWRKCTICTGGRICQVTWGLNTSTPFSRSDCSLRSWLTLDWKYHCYLIQLLVLFYKPLGA